MNLSLGEFEALVRKAFRGAGYPWGLAEDGANAARTLAECGEPAGASVVRLLEAVRDVPLSELMPGDDWHAPSGTACPICVGACLEDVGRPEVELGPMHEPALLLPEPPAVGDRHDRVELDAETLAALEGWAHRTYAPDTEASRIAGAGAGLTDND